MARARDTNELHLALVISQVRGQQERWSCLCDPSYGAWLHLLETLLNSGDCNAHRCNGDAQALRPALYPMRLHCSHDGPAINDLCVSDASKRIDTVPRCKNDLERNQPNLSRATVSSNS